MKFVTTLFALLLACSVLAQDGSGPAIRNMNGRGTNTTFVNATFTFLTNATERIYSVKAFGAVGDGKYANGCYATNGSVVIFCTNAPFVASDSGKYLMIDFGGTNGIQNWTSGISNVISATQVALSNAPVYSVTNKAAVYGTDDSAAIQLAISTITNGNTVILFPDDSTNTGTIYIVSRPLQDVGDYTNHHSSQIYAPNMLPANIQKSAVLTLRGSSAQMGGSISSDAYLKKAHGSIIVSMLTDGPDGVNRGSVFDFRGTDSTQSQGPSIFGLNQPYRFNSLCVVVEDLWIRGAYNNNLDLMNMQGCMNSGIFRCTFDGGFDWPSFDATKVWFPTRTNTIGFSLPQAYSDNRHPVEDTLVSFMHKGVIMGENAMFRGCQIFDCVVATDFSQSGGNLMSFTHCAFVVCSNMFANASGACMIQVNGLNIQNDIVTNWNLVIDPNDNFSGMIVYSESSAQANLRTNSSKIVGVNNRLLTVENSNYSPPTFLRPVNMTTSLQVAGKLTVKTNKVYMGSDSTNSTLTASSGKRLDFMMPRYSSAIYDAAWGSLEIASANSAAMYLGRTESGASPYGLTDIYIDLSNSADGANGQPRWHFSGDGQFRPYPGHTGLLGQPGGGYGTIGNMWASNAVFSAGRLTNGASVWFASTNTPPPTDVNHSYFSTSTNAPGLFFGWNGSAWIAIDDVIDQWQFTTPFANEALVLTNSATLTNAMTILTNSWIGIGLTNPGAQLDIKGNGTGHIMMGSPGIGSGYSGISFNGTLNAANYAFLGGVGDTSSYFSRPSGGSIIFREANGSDQVSIMSGGRLSPNVGIFTNASGFKHARISTGSIGAGSTAPITNTWVTAFADANYTVSASVVDSTASSLSLSVVHIDSVTTTNVVVRVLNNAVGSLTGVLHLIAIHD
jgi:hypothetical protein